MFLKTEFHTLAEIHTNISAIISLNEKLTCIFLKCTTKRYHMTPKSIF